MENRKIQNKNSVNTPRTAPRALIALRSTPHATRRAPHCLKSLPYALGDKASEAINSWVQTIFLTPSRGHNQRVGLRKSFKIGRFLAAGRLDTCSKRVTIRGRHSRALQLLWRELQGSDSEGSLGEMRRQAQADYDQVQKSEL